MFRLVCLSALTLVSFSSILGAWGQRRPLNTTEAPVDLHFPLSPNQAWAVEESLLVWKTYEDDADYAVYRRLDGFFSAQENDLYKIKHPAFKWSTGVRLKFTRYLPTNDPWDINLIGTYYYNQGEGHIDLNSFMTTTSVQDSLFSTWDTQGVGFAQEARANTQMNFFTFDLTAGRYYTLTRKIDIHPFIGVRSVLNYQNYKTTYFSRLTGAVGSVSDPFTKKRFDGSHDFWGIGPRIGTDLALKFGRHLSFLATLAGSFFAGRYNIEETLKGNKLFIPTTLFIPYREKINDEDTVLRSNVEASLGLGWEKWIKKKTVRIAPSFVFEVSEWFSLKRWIDSHLQRVAFSSGTQPQLHTHRRYSDLGLMGFNINLQVDF